MIRESDISGAIPSTGFVRAYVDFATERTDAPRAYHVPVALALVGSALPTEGGIPWSPDSMRGNVWGLLVGPSGDRKTAAISVGANILREAAGADAGVLADEVPGSVEALGHMLHEHSRRLIVYREFGSFLSQTIRGYAKPLREKYTELYDGQPSTIVYRSKRVQIEEPRVSLLCASTPAYLEAYTTPADWEGGFLSRFLVIAASRERTISMPRHDPAAGTHVAGLLRQLFTNAAALGPCLGFDDQATALWSDWYSTLDSYPSGERLHGAVQRAQNIALKAALLYAFDTGAARPGAGKPWYVPIDCLEPAVGLAELHLRSIKAVNDHVAENDDMRDRQSVFRVLSTPGAGALTLGDILGRARLLPKRAREVIEGLTEEKVIVAKREGNEMRWRLRPVTIVGHRDSALDARAARVAHVLRFRGVEGILDAAAGEESAAALLDDPIDPADLDAPTAAADTSPTFSLEDEAEGIAYPLADVDEA